MRTKIRYIILFLSILALQCKNAKNPEKDTNKVSKIQTILEDKVLRVVTDYNSTSYFIYRGQPLGYQFELLQELSNYMGVKLEVLANNKLNEKFDLLKKGKVDLIAVNLTITKERRNFLEFTEAHSQTRQVLIQKKYKNEKGEMMGLITSQLELGNKTIHVQNNSSYARRLRNLSDEIGENINIIETEEGLEQLIEMVATGQIDYTVSDENVAMVNKTYYDILDISLPVSFAQNLAWAVDKSALGLKEVIDAWMIEFKKTRKYAIIYNKYFKNKRTSDIIESEYFASVSGNISPYDEYIKEYCNEIGWDWRLIASMIYQESRFNPEAISWAGAFGLMQLMPNTARRFGVGVNSPTNLQIKAGIEFIRWLDNLFQEVTDITERQNFVLASYNVGPGHVMDAQRLAEKYKKDPDKWFGNVDEFLLKKADPEYYKDTIVKYGYCRGLETYSYVEDIIERYEHYKNLVD